MPLDTSIPLMTRGPQIENPQNLLANALRLKSAQMGIDEQQQQIQQRNALSNVLRQPGAYDSSGNLSRSVLPQIGSVAPMQVPQYAKLINEQDSNAVDKDVKHMTLARQKVQLQAQLLGSVKDQASYDNAKQIAAANGIDVSKLPPQYDPAFVQQALKGALTADQQFDQQYKQAMLDLSTRRQAFNEQNPTGQVVDTPNGVMVVNPRSGQARPATMGGQPTANPVSITTPQPMMLGAPTTPGAQAPNSAAAPLMGEKAAAAQKAQQTRTAASAQAKLGLDDILSSLDRMSSVAQELANDPALGKISGVEGIFPNMPGGDAANVQAKLENLKSQAGFAVLAAMRAASKTGGALGAVSDTEQKLLQNNLASLDTRQSPEQLRQQLLKIIDYASGVAGRSKSAYEKEFGPMQSEAPAASPATTGDYSHLWGG